MKCTPPLLCHFYLLTFEVPHARKDLSSCVTKLLIRKLKLPPPHQCGASHTGCAADTPTGEQSEAPWRTCCRRRVSASMAGWSPQLTAQTGLLRTPLQGPCFCLCSAPQDGAPLVTPLPPEALLLGPATQPHISRPLRCVLWS